MQHNSAIVHKFDDATVSSLKQELALLRKSDLWAVHFEGEYAKTGALRHGRTFWLRKIDHNMKLMVDRGDRYPESFKLLKTYSQGNVWGRSYWHWLPPGTVIDKHHDRKLGFSDDVLHRYQVYLDVPSEAEIWIDEGMFDASTLSNCVLDFNMFREHYYKNNSNQDLIFMVFDVFKDGVRIQDV